MAPRTRELGEAATRSASPSRRRSHMGGHGNAWQSRQCQCQVPPGPPTRRQCPSYTLAGAMRPPDSPDSGPVVIAYDGSDLAKAAVRAAARLLKPLPALVVTVWEPGLALISNVADAIPPGSE